MTCGNARRQSRWLRFTSLNRRQRGKSAALSSFSDVSGPQNQPVFVHGTKMKLRARGFEIVCEFAPGLVPNAYARTRGGIRRQGGQNDNQTRPNWNGAATNERERVGVVNSPLRGRSETASPVFICVLWVLVRCAVAYAAHASQSLNFLSCLTWMTVC